MTSLSSHRPEPMKKRRFGTRWEVGFVRIAVREQWRRSPQRRHRLQSVTTCHHGGSRVLRYGGSFL